MRSYQNSKRAEVGFARETRRGNLRGIPSPKSKRVSRTRIPTTSLVTSRKMGNRRFILFQWKPHCFIGLALIGKKKDFLFPWLIAQLDDE